MESIAAFLATKLGATPAASAVAHYPLEGAGGYHYGLNAAIQGGAIDHAVAIVGAAGQRTMLQLWAAGDDARRVPFGRWDVDSPLITGDGTLPAQASCCVNAFCWATDDSDTRSVFIACLLFPFCCSSAYFCQTLRHLT